MDVEGAEYEVLKGAKEILSASKDISILVEVHGKDTYGPTTELLRSNNFNIEFEKTYDNGEKHVLARKLYY
ncbi:MAG TPA: FkbM family methyltransferase [Nitrososphaeraceae archaeon]|nr:FkbM family methyltransferase [Nitrososphaeraceae archaeon]